MSAIQYAFVKSRRPIDCEILKQPTRKELSVKIAIFKPQILHFIGHGKESAGAPKHSYLELTSKTGGLAEEWTVQDISIDMLSWTPRPAFINACRTSTVNGPETSWAITQAFSQAKVPAVLGMQVTVAIGSCNSNVDNHALVNGCTYNDMIDVCRTSSSDHAQFTNCVNRLVTDWASA